MVKSAKQIKKAEQELAESQAKLETLTETHLKEI